MSQTLPTPSQPPKNSILLSETSEITCSCGSSVFAEGVRLRSIDAAKTGTGKNEVLPVAVIYCAKCLTPYTPPKIITPPSGIITP